MSKVAIVFLACAVILQCQADPIPQSGGLPFFNGNGMIDPMQFVSSAMGAIKPGVNGASAFVSGAAGQGQHYQSVMVSSSKQALDKDGNPITKTVTNLVTDNNGQVDRKTFEN